LTGTFFWQCIPEAGERQRRPFGSFPMDSLRHSESPARLVVTVLKVSTSAREALVRRSEVAIDPHAIGARDLENDIVGRQTADEVRRSALLHLMKYGRGDRTNAGRMTAQPHERRLLTDSRCNSTLTPGFVLACSGLSTNMPESEMPPCDHRCGQFSDPVTSSNATTELS